MSHSAAATAIPRSERRAASRPQVVEGGPKGFRVWRSYLSASEQDDIVGGLNSKATWWFPGVLGSYRFDQFRSGVDELAEWDELPEWAIGVSERMRRDAIFDSSRFVVQALRYLRGQGITAHRDARYFGNQIVAITLGSTRVLELTRRGRRQPTRVLLFPGDLYVMEGSARWIWKHGVPAVSVDEVDGRSVPRSDGFAVIWRAVERDVVVGPRRRRPYLLHWAAAALRPKGPSRT